MKRIAILVLWVMISSCKKEEIILPPKGTEIKMPLTSTVKKQDMHYGDTAQLKASVLEIVVYKHAVLGKEPKKNKNGVTSKKCVDYEIASIIRCEKFSPSVLRRIIGDPYMWLAADLENLPYEEWIRVKVEDLDGYGKVNIKVIEIVSRHPDEFMRLH